MEMSSPWMTWQSSNMIGILLKEEIWTQTPREAWCCVKEPMIILLPLCAQKDEWLQAESRGLAWDK